VAGEALSAEGDSSVGNTRKDVLSQPRQTIGCLLHNVNGGWLGGRDFGNDEICISQLVIVGRFDEGLAGENAQRIERQDPSWKATVWLCKVSTMIVWPLVDSTITVMEVEQ